MAARRVLTIAWHPVDRVLGAGITVCAVVIALVNANLFLAEAPSFDEWWVALVLGLLVLQLTSIAGWSGLPPATLRGFWAIQPFVLLLALVSAYAAWRGSPADAPFILPWLLDAPVLSTMALVVRLPFVVGMTLLLAAAPALSALVFLGEIPLLVLGHGFVHASNVIYVMLCLVLRPQLQALSRAHTVVESLHVEERSVREARDSLSEFKRIVHDDVISTLVAVIRADGRPSAALRGMAGTALERLRQSEAPVEQRAMTEFVAEEAARLILGSIETAAPGLKVTSDVGPGTVPSDAVGAIGLAAAEAGRNAVRHAGGGSGAVTVTGGAIRVVIADQGPGLRLEAISPDHFGVRESIIGRMSDLDGGRVQIDSGRTGTAVVMLWTRPDA
ncbi:ATP-binding protein [Microbacterium sp. No. 7]|uniref:ATP-binding protein n=1 Tax=Microbacterium sp. No. 7 TaxID=1714373 RepID=UPI0006CFE8D0|nr:ATP-binding protein [Microbacterium sp. No. 7]ALJ21173.1 hypothetical protein AOA12_15185 [Microbacterium sp. No. 7]